MKPHPAAELFPFIVGPDLYDLRAAIKKNGQRIPAVTHKGVLLDGRCRNWCCEQLEIPLKTIEFEGTEEEAIEFVIDVNMKRRHLGMGERAMIAAKLATLLRGKPSNPLGNNPNSAKLPNKTVAQAAKSMNVSVRSVTAAKKIMNEAPPELQEAVSTGAVKLNTAVATLTVKNGSAVFDNKIISSILGKLARAMEDKARATGKTAGYRKMNAAMNEAAKTWDLWMKESK